MQQRRRETALYLALVMVGLAPLPVLLMVIAFQALAVTPLWCSRQLPSLCGAAARAVSAAAPVSLRFARSQRCWPAADQMYQLHVRIQKHIA